MGGHNGDDGNDGNVISNDGDVFGNDGNLFGNDGNVFGNDGYDVVEAVVKVQYQVTEAWGRASTLHDKTT